MAVEFGGAAETIEHIVPIHAQVQELPDLLVDGQTAIDRCAIQLTDGAFRGIIDELHRYLPMAREIGGRCYT